MRFKSTLLKVTVTFLVAFSISFTGMFEKATAVTKPVTTVLIGASIGLLMICASNAKSNLKRQNNSFRDINNFVARDRTPTAVVSDVSLLGKTKYISPEFKCMSATEKAAMHLYALKSQMMVTGLNCNQDSIYNNFMLKNRPKIAAAEATLKNIFANRSKFTEDQFRTEIANEQSKNANRQGQAFCQNQSGLMKEALESSDVNNFALSKPQLMIEVCR